MPLSYFDCNCSIGRFAVPQPGSFFTPEALLAEMDYTGIDRALVYHAWAREYSPTEGNARLMEEITGFERLTPCWVVMPHHTGEFPAPAELIIKLDEQGIRAVRIFHARDFNNWSLSAWSAGGLFGVLAEMHIPLFVSFDQITWDAIYAIGKTYPGLPIVVTEVRYEEYRHLYPLFEALPNLHIDLCWTIVHFGLEAAVERFGPQRFLFGSRMPIFSAGPALCYIQYADLEDEARQLIAGDNLRRLLAWPKAASAQVQAKERG